MLPRSYANAVQRSGGVALVIPPDEAAVEDPDLVLGRVDALVLAGGSDVDPTSYGETPHPQTQRVWPERDRFELATATRPAGLASTRSGWSQGPWPRRRRVGTALR